MPMELSSMSRAESADIWAAFCATTRTMMPPEDWFDDPHAVLQWTGVDEDLHSQIAIWLTARVVNISSDTNGVFQDSEFHALRAAMANWEAMGGPATQPVVVRDRDAEADYPFPRILFSTHSSS